MIARHPGWTMTSANAARMRIRAPSSRSLSQTAHARWFADLTGRPTRSIPLSASIAPEAARRGVPTVGALRLRTLGGFASEESTLRSAIVDSDDRRLGCAAARERQSVRGISPAYEKAHRRVTGPLVNRRFSSLLLGPTHLEGRRDLSCIDISAPERLEQLASVALDRACAASGPFRAA